MYTDANTKINKSNKAEIDVRKIKNKKFHLPPKQTNINFKCLFL